MTLEEQERAYRFVADWHTAEAIKFDAMSKDEPRTAKSIRERAKEASRHHAGSAAALLIKAGDMHRAMLAARAKGGADGQ